MSTLDSNQQGLPEDQAGQGHRNNHHSVLDESLWYPTIIAMSVDKPWGIPSNQVLPAPGNSPHILEKNPMWSLSAWNVDDSKR